MTLLLVDNFDSFSFNLYQMMGAIYPRIEVVRNNGTTVSEIEAAGFAGIILSPGPGTPDESGVCLDIVHALSGSLPILGVCLGHQAICQVQGARIVRAEVPVHGKASEITHDGCGLFEGLSSPFTAGRYHSLVVEPSSLPDCFDVSAQAGNEIMAVRHRTQPTFGVQFHPESILTPKGDLLLRNFLSMLERPDAPT